MALYGHKLLQESAAFDDDLRDVNLQPYVEMMAYDDISRGNDEDIRQFCESAEAQVLMEKQVLNKSSFMRLSKADDQKRRIKLVTYQLAKERNDPDYKKMMLHRKKFKEFRAKLIKKYGNKAKKIAKVAQTQYIKAARKLPQEKMPSGVPSK